uniref:Protein translocase subunit SecA n=1 Tax=Agarophyton chilense TaxID=2510777 RepID=A0A141SEN6_AGACH|nr:preprotein translocase subunit SecA [Agarophyton chilense]AMK96754.1 preprotein translocase subunit SecA [Agarophyton chilense]ASP44649.1 preprotein translocase subunit SecA [Agarophyton chilense]UAD84317.1 preprotein-translocase subunit a [Agarophyton chilense]
MLNFFKKNTLNKFQNTINKIHYIENIVQNYSDAKLKNQTQELKKKIKENCNLKQILPESFAIVKEAIKRSTGMILFDVQLIGSIVLHQGKIAEMKTGEGKTVVAITTGYLNALTEKGVHIITVNDYLAKRDSELAQKICSYIDLKVGLITPSMNYKEKKQAYDCDITYITNSELGFDYLRDNMAIEFNQIVQRGFNFAIIDEVDSILIDEARTPLIVSGPFDIETNKYKKSTSIANTLEKTLDYEIDEKTKNITLTEKGINRCENILNIDNLYDIYDSWIQYLLNSLKAKDLFFKNQHYIIKNNEIMIVDEFTGRVMHGRRWSDGLHQAIESKENIPIQKENKTLASITYQNLFLLYEKLSGMTGTAKTEETELDKIYNLEVLEIPTNKSCKRQDLPDLVYKTEYKKWQAIADECFDMYHIGRPTLIGTTNVEKSELLAKILMQLQIPFNLLNAKPENVSREAEVITQAGRKNTITISTNMAGRGTDIILGGNPEALSKLALINYLQDKLGLGVNDLLNNIETQIKTISNDYILHIQELDIYKYKHIDLTEIQHYLEKIIGSEHTKDSEEENLQKLYLQILGEYKQICSQEKQEVLQLGGLYVIGTERHESRRIDNQLRGRAGRQGDIGASRFFLSLEDNLLRIFGGDKISQLMDNLNIDEHTPIESIILSKSLDSAQKKVESYFYDIRKQLFEYDEVINNQRQAIYAERKRILQSSFTRDCIIEYAESTIDEILVAFYQEDNINNKNYIINKVYQLLNLTENFQVNTVYNMNYKQTKEFLYEQLRISYDLRESYLEQLRPGLIRKLEKYYLLQQIDKAWQDHLDKMALLRESIGWRSYGQQDPLVEYKNEAFSLFINMVRYIRQTVTYLTMRSRLIININN